LRQEHWPDIVNLHRKRETDDWAMGGAGMMVLEKLMERARKKFAGVGNLLPN